MQQDGYVIGLAQTGVLQGEVEHLGQDQQDALVVLVGLGTGRLLVGVGAGVVQVRLLF